MAIPRDKYQYLLDIKEAIDHFSITVAEMYELVEKVIRDVDPDNPLNDKQTWQDVDAYFTQAYIDFQTEIQKRFNNFPKNK